MVLKVYNTLTKQKEEFVPIKENVVKMYNCGPTVYDLFHIGNARNFITFDIVWRYLEYKGYKVKYVQNITDIEDKIINKANREGVTSEEIAKKYTELYFKCSDALGVRRADIYPRATDHIKQIINLVKILEEKGYAYEIDGDVYFRVRKFENYGKLSGKKIDELMEGARVEVDSRKEDPLDFSLWKSSKPGEPVWESPWGKGRPGWHIECSAMSMEYLGETFDIHSGGVDLIFPHHENEIAQSESATGKPFVNYWLHNAFMNINQEKMSKSLGNIVTVKDLLDKFEPQVIRYFMLTAHYRKVMDYSDDSLEEAQKGLSKLRDCVDTIFKVYGKEINTNISIQTLKAEKVVEFKTKFEEAMEDDFNIPRALAVLFDLTSYIYDLKQSASSTDKLRLSEAITLLMSLGNVLGLDLSPKIIIPESTDINNLMKLLIEVRDIARKEKHFTIADKIREGLNQIDILLEDHPEGTIWKKK